MAKIEAKTFTTYEWGILGGALVAFVGLFFHAYGVSFKSGNTLGAFGSLSGHVSGWHFVGLWFPTLLMVAAAGLVAVRALRGDLIPSTLPVGTRVVVAGAAVLAVLIAVIRALTYPSVGGGFKAGASFGTYLVVLALVVAAAFAVLDLRASGEKIPSLPSRPDRNAAA